MLSDEERKAIEKLREEIDNIKKVIIPYDNIADIDEIPEEIKNTIEYIPVKTYDEVYKIIFENAKR